MLSSPFIKRLYRTGCRAHTTLIKPYGPKKGDRAMSGGVDSSAAALLLSQKDYDLSAVYMRNWDARDESGSDIGCEWEKDWEYVTRVCKQLDIPCRMIDLSIQYWNRVFEPALEAWKTGDLTPNPDVWCNREIKFGVLMETLLTSPSQWLATGHYASLRWSEEGRPMLYRARDRQKDQTYFLSSVPESSLSKAIFPLHRHTKQEVRELASRHSLPTAQRAESMGLCFVGEKRRFNDFLSEYLPSQPGEIVDLYGEVVSRHDGLWRYTIGQGAKIPGMVEKMFVVAKDAVNNRLIVAPGTDHPALYTKSIIVHKWHWIWKGFQIQPYFQARVQVRHKMNDVPCTVEADSIDDVKITFKTPLKAVSTGQVAVIWDEEWCLGCGTIVGTNSA